MDHEAEADAARDEDEDAQAEHDDDPDLAAPVCVEAQQERQRHDQDDHVLRYGEARGGVDQGVDVEAVVRDGVVALPGFPDGADGPALEDLEGDKCCRRHEDPPHDHPAEHAEAWVGKEAQVEEEYRDLGQAEEGEVQALADIEELVTVNQPDFAQSGQIARSEVKHSPSGQT